MRPMGLDRRRMSPKTCSPVPMGTAWTIFCELQGIFSQDLPLYTRDLLSIKIGVSFVTPLPRFS
jgi:hypothetical protein